MRTLNVSISDLEYESFGLSKENLSFSEFLDVVGKQLSRQLLNNSIRLAEKHELSTLSMDDISQEVKSVRKCKK